MKLNKFEKFYKKDFLTDVEIIKELDENNSKTYNSHKILLAANSNLFESIFKKHPENKKFKLPKGIKPFTSKINFDSDERLLKYFYIDNLSIEKLENEGLRIENVFYYYSSAKNYGNENLMSILKDYILKNISSINGIKLLLEGIKFNQNEWIDKGKKYVLENFENIINDSYLKKFVFDLPFDYFYELIKDKNLNISTEDTAFEIALEYMKLREKLKTKEEIEIEQQEKKDENKNIEDKKEENKKEDDKKDDIKVEDKKEENKKEEDKKDDKKVEDKKEENKKEEDKKDDKKVEDKKEENKKEDDKKDDNKKEEEIIQIISSDDEEEACKKVKKYKLSDHQKNQLILSLRFTFISHQCLLQNSKDQILHQFNELILEALSAKLKVYEKIESNYTILLSPRKKYEIKNEKKNSKIYKKDNKDLEKHKNNNKIDNNNAYISNDEHSEEKEENENEDNNNIDNENENKNYSKNNKNKIQKVINSNKLKNSKNNNELQKNKINNENGNWIRNIFNKTKERINNSKNETKEYIDFNYQYNFDKNGVLYYLGTKGNIKKNNYENPYDIGEVKVFFSSMGKGSYKDFVGRELVNCRTMNEGYAYMGIDFGNKRKLIPTHYSIKNRNSNKHIMMNWVLEGSNDMKDWAILDKRIHLTNDSDFNEIMIKERESLSSKGATTTWNIEVNFIQNLQKDNKDFKGFSIFRIKQISANSSGSYNLACSGFEIYGRGFGNWSYKN